MSTFEETKTLRAELFHLRQKLDLLRSNPDNTQLEETKMIIRRYHELVEQLERQTKSHSTNHVNSSTPVKSVLPCQTDLNPWTEESFRTIDEEPSSPTILDKTGEYLSEFQFPRPLSLSQMTASWTKNTNYREWFDKLFKDRFPLENGKRESNESQ